MKITYDEFIETYRPIPNPIPGHETSFEGYMFETYGEELAFVKAYLDTPWDQRKIFTIVEEDGILYLTSGFHCINRLGYILTEVPYQGSYLDIQLD